MLECRKVEVCAIDDRVGGVGAWLPGYHIRHLDDALDGRLLWERALRDIYQGSALVPQSADVV